ncbi:NGG1p interacting factor 3 [Annulohypoxylon maeteangense]|uniref:NGG1p interacting factor 3 n=1 Tax=Annulohypoxylon maeteangense TaxID=1927788 RepID=UPI00200771D2|nr:NGG1p interacting factor 3 [Annulohypoxylon maeteangense]KAI0886692.1 NGG1p interacting factor 3 [Annulohypoxylon maeteangense]
MVFYRQPNSLKILPKHISLCSPSRTYTYNIKGAKSISNFTNIGGSYNLVLRGQTQSFKARRTFILQERGFSTSKIMAAPPPTSLTDAVVTAMKILFPEELADSAWDNTGLLLGQAPSPPSAKIEKEVGGTVLLTNDLTSAVVDEALKERANMIVCYHPVIFRPLKSLTTKDPMQTLLLRLIAERISVYCPHTAMDAASGGLNDWLCDILLDGEHQAKRTVVQPISRPLPEGHEYTGYGRTVELGRPINLQTLLKRLSAGIGNQRYIMVALPPSLKGLTSTQEISKVAVCAGSGADVLKDTDAQVLVTGEMAHHYALRHTQLGQIVVTVFHSNSERKYLETRLKPMLEVELETTAFGNTRIIVSKADRDPYEVIDVRDLA